MKPLPASLLESVRAFKKALNEHPTNMKPMKPPIEFTLSSKDHKGMEVALGWLTPQLRRCAGFSLRDCVLSKTCHPFSVSSQRVADQIQGVYKEVMSIRKKGGVTVFTHDPCMNSCTLKTGVPKIELDDLVMRPRGIFGELTEADLSKRIDANSDACCLAESRLNHKFATQDAIFQRRIDDGIRLVLPKHRWSTTKKVLDRLLFVVQVAAIAYVVLKVFA